MPLRRRPILRVLNPGQVVALAFAAAILLGTGLLMLPVAAAGPGGTSALTAFFTATSAICVTGHAVVDTARHWTVFGQVVIMGLVQIGGFGIMTAASVLFLLIGRRIGLRGRRLAQAETQAVTADDLRAVLRRLAVFTLAVEAVLALWIAAGQWGRYGRPPGEALWLGAFHSVTAFNNAGFALWSDNLVGFRDDWLMLVPVGLGVIVGGVGLPVWSDLARHRRRARRWSLTTKLTLWGTGALLAGGTAAYLATEWTNDRTLGSMPVAERLLNAWFQSVTTRTAGFNTVPQGDLREESLLVSDMLMFVGGGSASTAGGIKVATFLVLGLIVLGEARGGRAAEAFGRTVPPSSLRQSLAVAFLAINCITLATVALLALTPFSLSQCLFEATSAFATVGLSTGITPELGTAGQLILVALMYVGRVGPVTLAVALAARERERLYAYPEEQPLIG
jgi:potassium uptake TrkH family protein